MLGKAITQAHGHISFILAIFIGLMACGTGPAAAGPTSVPTNPPDATLTPILVLPSPTATSTTAPSASVQTDTGWQGDYYNNDAWQEPVTLRRADADPNFDWAYESPAPGIPVDNFTVRWTRCLDLEERYYLFTAYGDDYVRVLVDDVQVLDTPVYANVAIPFAVSAGQHCIKVEYREFIGYSNVFFSFQPGDAFPGSSDASSAWKGEYFNNKDFAEPVTYMRNDAVPQFDWQQGNPAPGIPIDGFSVRWTRCLEMEGRDYVFTAHADEYVSVLLDDVQVLEAPLSVNAEAPIAVSAGQHCIKVEYREEAGSASVYFDFK
jgi:hypothetical protein